MENSLIVDGLNIAELDDDELLERLKRLGFIPGPILSSTREVYERKLARLMRNEDFDDVVNDNIEGDIQDDVSGSPVLNTSYESSYSGSSSFNMEDLRRRPLSRVKDQNWSHDPPVLTPHKPWSPDDIISQLQPPPGEEEKPLVSNTSIAVAIIAFLIFAFFVYYNMESTPQTPL